MSTRRPYRHVAFAAADAVGVEQELTSVVAHDFNVLLVVILSYADFAAEALPADSQVRDDIEHIRHAAQRATALARQLLSLSGDAAHPTEAVGHQRAGRRSRRAPAVRGRGGLVDRLATIRPALENPGGRGGTLDP